MRSRTPPFIENTVGEIAGGRAQHPQMLGASTVAHLGMRTTRYFANSILEGDRLIYTRRG